MDNSTTSALVLSPDSEECRNDMPKSCTNSLQAPSQKICDSSHGPVAILWDIENCPVPSDVRPEDVAGNIRMALRVHPVIKGAVTMFSSYGDFNAFPRRLREGCQRTGVKLIDVPNGRKDAADKAILVDMFLFALDNPPPSFIMLISGDVDFAPALHILGQRGYTVILVIPSGVGVSSALCNAGRFVWDWPSVARGEGFMPPAKTLSPPRGFSVDIAGLLRGCHVHEISDNPSEEEAILYRGLSQNAQEFSIPMPYYSSSLRSQSLPSGLNQVPAGTLSPCDHNDLMSVQPGDINGLKLQLVKLLDLSGGCVPLTRLPMEYKKLYDRPLYVSQYGASKLVNLLKKMADAVGIEGKGQKKIVYLLKSRSEPDSSPIILAKRDRKGKGSHEETVGILMTGAGSSDECSDDERVVVEEQGTEREKPDTSQSTVISQNLEKFKYELQEILVSYSCRIFLGCFEAIYQQRYKRPLEYDSFGMNELEELLEMVKDVVVLQEEPVTRRKFLVAVGW